MRRDDSRVRGRALRGRQAPRPAACLSYVLSLCYIALSLSSLGLRFQEMHTHTHHHTHV